MMGKFSKFSISMVIFLPIVLLLGPASIFSHAPTKKPVQKFKRLGSQKLPARRRIKKTVTIKPPRAICYQPPHTRGDRDFNGPGPKVSCSVRIYKNANNQQIMCTISMTAIETRKDFSRASGGTWKSIYRAPAGWSIDRILTPTSSTKKYTDTNHDKDFFHMGNYGLVKSFAFIGDLEYFLTQP